MGLSFAAQLSQNTPMTLKIFQTRIYAQAFTVAALCAAAAITVTDDDEETRKAVRLPFSGSKMRRARARVSPGPLGSTRSHACRRRRTSSRGSNMALAGSRELAQREGKTARGAVLIARRTAGL